MSIYVFVKYLANLHERLFLNISLSSPIVTFVLSIINSSRLISISDVGTFRIENQCLIPLIKPYLQDIERDGISKVYIRLRLMLYPENSQHKSSDFRAKNFWISGLMLDLYRD